MTKQKKTIEDNRDIFDKVLDYATPIAGAYLGGKVGAKLGRSLLGAKSSAQYEKVAKKLDSNGKYVGAGNVREMNNSARIVAAPFAVGGMGVGALGGAILRGETKKKRRK